MQLRAAGALVEEAASDDEEGEEELVLDEKAALAVIGKTEHAGAGAGATAEADVVVGSWMSGRSSVTNASEAIRSNDGDTPR